MASVSFATTPVMDDAHSPACRGIRAAHGLTAASPPDIREYFNFSAFGGTGGAAVRRHATAPGALEPVAGNGNGEADEFFYVPGRIASEDGAGALFDHDALFDLDDEDEEQWQPQLVSGTRGGGAEEVLSKDAWARHGRHTSGGEQREQRSARGFNILSTQPLSRQEKPLLSTHAPPPCVEGLTCAKAFLPPQGPLPAGAVLLATPPVGAPATTRRANTMPAPDDVEAWLSRPRPDASALGPRAQKAGGYAGGCGGGYAAGFAGRDCSEGQLFSGGSTGGRLRALRNQGRSLLRDLDQPPTRRERIAAQQASAAVAAAAGRAVQAPQIAPPPTPVKPLLSDGAAGAPMLPTAAAEERRYPDDRRFPTLLSSRAPPKDAEGLGASMEPLKVHVKSMSALLEEELATLSAGLMSPLFLRQPPGLMKSELVIKAPPGFLHA